MRLCACEEKEKVLTVGCETRGIGRLSEINPVYYPTYHLLLTGNLLNKLSVNDFVEYTGLTILHLGNNDISEGLRRLHLNNNKINALKSELFFGLENLEYLQMDDNYITHMEAKALGTLTHLKVLILNDNLIASLPTNIFQLVPLTHLDLRGNQLKTLPYSGLLKHMTSVVELQLEENPVTYFIKEFDINTFRHIPNLQLLFLNNNLLKTLPEGTFNGLMLARLNLRNNHLRSLPVRGVLYKLTALVQ
ncbi:hypothetical protein CRUP_008812, partial [Coryphaenoides rupestris]